MMCLVLVACVFMRGEMGGRAADAEPLNVHEGEIEPLLAAVFVGDTVSLLGETADK